MTVKLSNATLRITLRLADNLRHRQPIKHRLATQRTILAEEVAHRLAPVGGPGTGEPILNRRHARQ
ncbi:hypothetical protein GCM10027595_00350 [Corynebacterium nasicanis]